MTSCLKNNGYGLGLILALLFSSRICPAFCSTPEDTLTFLHVSDTHISNMAGYHPDFGKIDSAKHARAALLENFLLKTPRAVGADMVVITGDMLHLYEAETADGLFQATEVEQFAAMVQQSPVPLFMVLGNHDIRSYWINKESSTLNLFQFHAQAARAAWIRNIACFRDGFYYHRIQQVGKTRYHFFFLDNSYDLPDGAFMDGPQLDWLRHELVGTGVEPVVIFMHKYLPALDFNKDGMSFSAASASVLNDSTCSQGFLQICNENKNIQLLLVGHGHSRKSEQIPFPNGHNILQLSTGAFIKNVHNWRIVKCTEQELLLFAPGTRDLEWRIPND